MQQGRNIFQKMSKRSFLIPIVTVFALVIIAFIARTLNNTKVDDENQNTSTQPSSSNNINDTNAQSLINKLSIEGTLSYDMLPDCQYNDLVNGLIGSIQNLENGRVLTYATIHQVVDHKFSTDITVCRKFIIDKPNDMFAESNPNPFKIVSYSPVSDIVIISNNTASGFDNIYKFYNVSTNKIIEPNLPVLKTTDNIKGWKAQYQTFNNKGYIIYYPEVILSTEEENYTDDNLDFNVIRADEQKVTEILNDYPVYIFNSDGILAVILKNGLSSRYKFDFYMLDLVNFKIQLYDDISENKKMLVSIDQKELFK